MLAYVNFLFRLHYLITISMGRHLSYHIQRIYSCHEKDGLRFYWLVEFKLSLSVQVSFTDLRPPPRFAAPINKKTFWIVLSKLNDLKSNENTQLRNEVTSRNIQRAVSVLQRSVCIQFHYFTILTLKKHWPELWNLDRFRSWENNAYRSMVQEVNNVKGIIPALRTLAVQYYITVSILHVGALLLSTICLSLFRLHSCVIFLLKFLKMKQK